MDELGPTLRGQVALVSGASRGIGLGISAGLMGAGARVAMLARSADVLTSAAEPFRDAALPVAADVTEPGEVETAIAQVERHWATVDLLVHNAGTADVIGPLWQADPDGWWREVTVHLRGTMLLARACLPRMIERGRGRIILNYGNLGDRDEPWTTAYAAGKAGLLRMVGQLHAELEDTGVHVFGLHPGLVWTPMTAALAEDPAKQRWLPRFANRPSEDYGTADAASDMVVRIAAGEADELSGLLLGAWDDVGQLTAEVDHLRANHRRVLRVPW